MGRPIRPFDEMAKRKKRIATATRKLGILINCRVQKPFLKDLDAYRKSLKLSRPAALVKLATEQLAGLRSQPKNYGKAPSNECSRRPVELKATIPNDRAAIQLMSAIGTKRTWLVHRTCPLWG